MLKRPLMRMLLSFTLLSSLMAFPSQAYKVKAYGIDVSQVSNENIIMPGLTEAPLDPGYTMPQTEESLSSEGRKDIVSFARQYVGVTRYVNGGRSFQGADCSGFVGLVLENFGITVPRSSAEIYAACPIFVSESEMLPGDLIFYGSGSVNHVAFYTGDNSIVHSTNSRRGYVLEDSGYSAVHYDNIIAIGRYW